MTSPQAVSLLSARPSGVPDVVAGMLRGPLAAAVARAAVREAARRGARVRFLQVYAEDVADEERATGDELTFAVALRALREAPRVKVAFEVVEGEAAVRLVERSGRAGVLVVPADGATADVAAYCRGHARCPVIVVDD